MKVASNKRVVLTLLALVVVGAALVVGGNAMTDRALSLVSERKSSHLRSMLELTDREVSRSQTIVWLEKNAFFQRRLHESTEVLSLKRTVGLQDLDRYFHSPWDLIRYLDFIGERRLIYDLLSNALRSGVFVNKDKCLTIPTCQEWSVAISVNDDQIDRLVEALRAYYLDPAVKLYEAGAIADAQRIAGDLALLLRNIHFIENRSLDAYNDILVVTAFLSRGSSTASERSPSASDLNLLRQFVRSALPSDDKHPNRLVGDYVKATSLLRRNCFVAASEAFAAPLDKMNHDLLRELFAFMSLRSLARPFVDISRLRLGADDRIDVRDCDDKIVEASTFETQFNANSASFREKFIRHVGLRGNLEWYAATFPSSASARGAPLAIRIRELEQSRPAEKHNGRADVPHAPGTETEVPEGSRPLQKRSEAPDPPLNKANADDQRPEQTRSSFRWPVRGRIISSYTGKGGNEGINIAVPLGTQVRSAEIGTVAYAGNEVKGYGLLVLVRHPGNYVTAYAHNSELLVRRGETVKRGQVIAKTGQSGNVSSPQLHFEVRVGTRPTDPVPLMSD